MAVVVDTRVILVFLVWSGCLRKEGRALLDPDCPSLCQCSRNDTFVDCFNHGRRLTYIPKLPPEATSLNFTDNYLVELIKDTLRNISLTNLVHLNLKKNSISYISRDAFDHFAKLEFLDIGYNSFSAASLQEAFYSIGRLPNLRSLEIGKNGVSLSNATESFWNHLNNSNLEQLLMYHDGLTFFNQSLLTGTRHVQYLNLRGNVITTFVPAFDTTPNLIHLDLGYNLLYKLPSFCNGMQAAYPNLQNLTLSFNALWIIEHGKLNCLTNLKYLDLTANVIQQIHNGIFSGLVNLIRVSLSYLRTEGYKPRFFNSSAFANTSIHHLTLFSSGIRAGRDILSTSFFNGSTSLRYLYLGQNSFSDVGDSFFEELFSPLTGLMFLDLSSCELLTIPSAISKLTNLRELWLFHNYIVQWTSDVFGPLKHLVNISLDKNQITTVDQDSFPPGMIQNLRALNLSSNPISCTCDIMWFMTWMKRNTSLFTGDVIRGYVCRSPVNVAGDSVVNLTMTETSCLMSTNTSILIINLFSIILLIAVVVPMAVRFRWQIQTTVFMRRYQTLRAENRRHGRTYDYDAFLIYSDADSRWVRQTLLPHLERDRGLRLCVHERNFLPGKLIIDNIVDSMLASRRVIALLSNALLNSEWCQFELNLAHTETVTNSAAPLILLLMEEIAAHNTTPVLYALLKTTTYICVPSHPGLMENFWQHVYGALAERSLAEADAVSFP